MSDKISDEMAAEAWRGIHEGLQRLGAESEAIDTLCDYFDQAHPTDEDEVEGFDFAFTPPTPPIGMVSFINLSVRSGQFHVIARQGKEDGTCTWAEFDLPIEALHQLRAALNAIRRGE